MKDRVYGDGKGTVAITYDWKRFVEEPQKQGYYAEAFSSADAMLDDLIYRLFQLSYQTNDNFNLVNFLKTRLKRFQSPLLGDFFCNCMAVVFPMPLTP